MLSRPRRASLLTALLVSSVWVGACEKVPLLAPSGSTLTLTASATALPLNGSTQLIAQVIEPAGTPPHSGTAVTFTTTLGSIEPADASTDSAGRVVVTFKAGTTNGTATISAISGGVSASGNNAVKIALGTAAVGRVIVSASPTLIPSLGGSSTITASVLDINGNALGLAPVTFSTTAGALSSVLVTTDANGVASTTLQTSTQATVTASVGAQGTTPPSTGTPGTGTPGTGTTGATAGQASGTVTVSVAAAPTLVITPPATAPSAGLPAAFTFVVTPAATNPSPVRAATVTWGDNTATQQLGTISGSVVASHSYAAAGLYVITGTITDGFGNVVSVSIPVTVNPKAQPTVAIVATTPNPTAGTDMVFTASVAPAANTGTVIVGVTIVFDSVDGSKTELGAVTGNAISLHHVYPSNGTYTVVLSAVDSNGGIGTATTTVFVQAATPLGATLTVTKTIVDASNTLGTFTATVTGLGNSVVLTYHWVFGDGQVADSTTNTVVHNYTHPAVPPTLTATVFITTSALSGNTANGSVAITP